MKKLCMLILMSLVLIVGLRGFSASEDSPYQAQGVVGPTNDHPWGGDQGRNGGGTTNILKPTLPSVNTGNVVVDFIINRVTWRTSLWQNLVMSKPKPTPARIHITPSAPATGGNNNHAN